jgi:hypothetical protein
MELTTGRRAIQPYETMLPNLYVDNLLPQKRGNICRSSQRHLLSWSYGQKAYVVHKGCPSLGDERVQMLCPSRLTMLALQ